MFRCLIERLQWAKADQGGSVIVIALLLLVVMTLIGVTGTDTVVIENQIIRNVGIHSQNVRLVESGVMEGFQEVLQASTAELEQITQGGADALSWGNDLDNWADGVNDAAFYNANTVAQLDPTNPSNSTNSMEPAGVASTIGGRGETDTLRVALVGWVQGGSISATDPIRERFGVMLAEYMSPNYGMQRLAVGFKTLF